MTIQELYNQIDQRFPFATQAWWDQSGLISAGALANYTTVQNPILSLDLNTQVVQYAISQQSNLVVAHHPLYINPADQNSWEVQNIYQLLKKHHIFLLAVHTNFDQAYLGMNYQLLKSLGCTNIHQHRLSPYLWIGDWLHSASWQTLLTTIQKAWEIDYLHHLKPAAGSFHKPQWRIAVTGGSGAEGINYLQASEQIDLFVTSEVKWHIWNKSLTLPYVLVAAPHSMEKIFIKSMWHFFPKLTWLLYQPPVFQSVW